MSMTATDELRRLLDERGVKWEDDTPVPSMKPWKTSFTSFTGEEVSIGCYDEPKWIMGTLVFHTPEQAIAATLGPFTSDEEKRDFEAFRDGEWVEASVYRSLKAQYDELKVTLGRGKCHNTSYRLDESRFHCSECRFGCWVKDVADGLDKLPQHCPRCGREVER